MIKLALTDLDDTLIHFGASHANQATIDAVRQALAAGVRFGPMTGRPPVAMGWMFGAGNENCWQTGGFSNGQIIYLDGKLVHSVELPREALETTIALVDQTDDARFTIYSIDEDGRYDFVTTRPELVTREFQWMLGPKRGIVDTLPAGKLYKANIHCACSRERMAQIRDALNAQVEGLDFVFPSMTAPVIDISPRGWNKGSAVCALAEAMGIGLDEVAVFGDSENDLSMIRAVPNSVAVANAAPEVATAARWHIGACADDAVPAALEDIARAACECGMPAFMRG